MNEREGGKNKKLRKSRLVKLAKVHPGLVQIPFHFVL